MSITYNYYKEAFRGLQMPFAFVDLDLLDKNISDLKRRAGAKSIRIASKSIRSVGMIMHILGTDPQFRGVMAYHPREAVFLSKKGIDDILIGYPCFHEEDIRPVLAEIADGKKIVFMIDAEIQALQINRLAMAMNITAPVCIDVDMSTDFPAIHFGVYRSPIRTADDVEKIVTQVSHFPNIRVVGMMGYEAQIAGLGDAARGQIAKNAVIRLLKKRSIAEISERREAMAERLRTMGVTLEIVNGGGTGSLESTVKEKCITEVTIGSGFYASGLFDNYRVFRHLPAAGFAVEITRKPRENIFTCYGGGYIASGETGFSKQPKPYLPEDFSLVAAEGCGEVQTPIVYKGDELLEIGDPVFFRHSKAGELCERFNSLYLLSGGKVFNKVPTYRGEGQSFL